ncbi:hypothetical protein R3P38DRAFT_2816034 [Favolaschia claudopus]|uniref:Ribosome biogenesis protein NSA1 n=1 Tax=Favolaschia claudopus TaxID=2862362 RepID=A0AAV9Z0C1_9AGAR
MVVGREDFAQSRSSQRGTFDAIFVLFGNPGKSRGLPNKPGCQLELSVYFRHYLNLHKHYVRPLIHFSTLCQRFAYLLSCRRLQEKCWIVLSTITALKHELRSKLNLEVAHRLFFVRTAEDKAYPLAKSETPARYRNMPICASLNPKENLLLIRTLTARENIPYREWLYELQIPKSSNNVFASNSGLTVRLIASRVESYSSTPISWPLDFSDIVELYKRPSGSYSPVWFIKPTGDCLHHAKSSWQILSFPLRLRTCCSIQEVLAIGSDTGTLKIFDIGPARKKVVDIAFTSSITGVGLIVRQKLGRRRIGVLIDCANGDLETIIVPIYLLPKHFLVEFGAAPALFAYDPYRWRRGENQNKGKKGGKEKGISGKLVQFVK